MNEKRTLKRVVKKDYSKIKVMNDRAMNGEEIAKELEITRQSVSSVLKIAMKKVFLKTAQLDKEWTPFQVATVMSQMFKVSQAEDLKKFFNLFPSDIRSLIETDAKNYLRQKDQAKC